MIIFVRSKLLEPLGEPANVNSCLFELLMNYSLTMWTTALSHHIKFEKRLVEIILKSRVFISFFIFYILYPFHGISRKRISKNQMVKFEVRA